MSHRNYVSLTNELAQVKSISNTKNDIKSTENQILEIFNQIPTEKHDMQRILSKYSTGLFQDTAKAKQRKMNKDH